MNALVPDDWPDGNITAALSMRASMNPNANTSPPSSRQQAKAKRAQKGAAARKSAAVAKPREAAGARAVNAAGMRSASAQAAAPASTAPRVFRAQAGDTAAQQPPAAAGRPEAGQVSILPRADALDSAAECPASHSAARGGKSRAVKRGVSRPDTAAKASVTEPRTHRKLVAGLGGNPSRFENHDPNSTRSTSRFSGACAELALVAASIPGTCLFVVLLT